MNRKKLRKIKSAVFAMLLVIAMVGESLSVFAAVDIDDLGAVEESEIQAPATLEMPEEELPGGDMPELAESPVEEPIDESEGTVADDLQVGSEGIDEYVLDEEGADAALSDEAKDEDGSSVKYEYDDLNVSSIDGLSLDGISADDKTTRYLLVGETDYFVDLADPYWDDYFRTKYGAAALHRTSKYFSKPSGIIAFNKKKLSGYKVVGVTGKKAGTTVKTDKAYWSSYRIRYIFTNTNEVTYIVCKPELTQKSFKINDPSSTVNLSSYITGLSGYDDTYTIQWASSNTKVAAVSSSGLVSFNSKGSANVTGTFYNSKGQKCCKVSASFNVVVPTLSKTLVVLKPGKNTKVTLRNATNVTWSVANSDSVSVAPSGKNNETVTITANKPGVNFVYAKVPTAKGTAEYKVVVGIEQTEYDMTFTVGSEKYEGRKDYKMEAQMIDLCNKSRRANGLPEFTAKNALWDGTGKRASQLMLGNPRGEAVYTDPYGASTYEMDSYQPASASSSFNFFYKAKTGYLKTVLGDASYKNIGVTVYRTKAKIPVTLSGKVQKCNCFMVSAIGK